MRVLTNDVFAAAFLLTEGSVLVGVLVDRSPARSSGTFVLEGNTALEAHQAYCTGEATCRVKALRDAVTHLRACLARALRQPAHHRSSEARTASL